MAHLPPIERRLSHGAIKTIDKGRTQVFRRELPSNHGLYEEVKTGCRRIFDIVVFDFLLSIEKYLNDPQLQVKCSFEAVSYMYMKRAVFVHFRKQKAQKRSTEAGSDISLDSMDMNISNHSTMETASNLEYREMVKQIENGLTEEQKKIFSNKVKGYSLKEIADNHGIKQKRVYKQFDKVKRIVTEVMEA